MRNKSTQGSGYEIELCAALRDICVVSQGMHTVWYAPHTTAVKRQTHTNNTTTRAFVLLTKSPLLVREPEFKHEREIFTQSGRMHL